MSNVSILFQRQRRGSLEVFLATMLQAHTQMPMKAKKVTAVRIPRRSLMSIDNYLRSRRLVPSPCR